MALLIRRGQRPQIQFKPTQWQQGQTITLPAPYAGINLRDDITSLRPNEARVLENWITREGNLGIRDGYATHVTGAGAGEVQTLASYVGPASNKLIAAGGGAIYDVTTAGTATSLATGFVVNRWQTALYGGRLFLVNGTDAPQDFDGSAIAATSWTGSGLTAVNLINVAVVRNRVWLIERDTAFAWYGAAGAITGATTKFDVGQIASGGYLMAVGSWSRDAGDGADDFTVFVMSTGELLVYQGDVSSSFTLVGKFPGAPPIGRQCLFNVGGELIVITRVGLLPVSAAIGGVAMDLARIDPWGKIAPEIVVEAGRHSTQPGWAGTLHEGVVYCNIPQVDGALWEQQVLNTRTGSWSTFSGWPAATLASHNGTLYMGTGDGRVLTANGRDDGGAAITARASGAFVVPQRQPNNNLFTLIRPKVQTTGGVSGLVGVDTDYVVRGRIGQNVGISSDVQQTPWGSEWGSPWGARSRADPRWFSITGEGRSVSVRFQVTAQSRDMEWFATDLVFKPGGIR